MKYPARILITRTEEDMNSIHEYILDGDFTTYESEYGIFQHHEFKDLQIYSCFVRSPKAGFSAKNNVRKILGTTHEPAIIYISASVLPLLNALAPIRILQEGDNLEEIFTEEFFDEDLAINNFLIQQRRYVMEHLDYDEEKIKQRK